MPIRSLERSLSLYAQQDNLAPAAFASTPSVPVTDVNAAVAHQMSDVVQRLFHNSYAQGFDAVLLLATYRFSVLVQWLPWVAAFVLIACFDGYMVRIIRSKEFLEHSPMRFALCAVGATLALALTLLLLVIPASRPSGRAGVRTAGAGYVRRPCDQPLSSVTGATATR